MQKIEPTHCKDFILLVHSANGNRQLQAKDSEGSDTSTPTSASRLFPGRWGKAFVFVFLKQNSDPKIGSSGEDYQVVKSHQRR